MTVIIRNGSAAFWKSSNPLLASGEPGVETDTQKLKVGDGKRRWNLLPYVSPGPTGPPGADGVFPPVIDGGKP